MAEGRRYDLGFGDARFDKKTFPLWHYGIVTDIEDPYNAGRIKVRIYPLDNDTPILLEDVTFEAGGLPWCEPLLPKFINVVPKVGEMVKIITFDYRNKKIRRQYLGPVIGQQSPSDLLTSNYNDAKLKVENKAYTSNWALNTEAIDGNWKIYPSKEDVAFLGRKNTDLILRDANYYDEIILRSGKIDSSSLTKSYVDNTSPVVLNKKNPGYVTINFTEASALQNSSNPEVKNLNLQNDRSHVNIVADKVNLISHEGSDRKGYVRSILKGEDVLAQIKTENEKLHPLPYGDVLWEFLNVLRPYVEGHIHKASRREPDGDITKNNLIKWFNDNMGNQVSKPNPDGTSYVTIENCRFLSKGVKTN
jgi:hypothetical protein